MLFYDVEESVVWYGSRDVKVPEIFSVLPNFQFDREDKIAVIGPSGSGKTSLMKALSGYFWSGQISVDQMDLTDLTIREKSRMISWIPERFEWPMQMTALEMVQLGYSPWGKNSEDQVQKILQQFHLLGLDPNQIIHTMSSGEKRRLITIHALNQQAKVLLIDEPTANLDPLHSFKVLQLLAEANAMMFFATHDLGLAVHFANKMIVLNERSVVFCGLTREMDVQSILKDVFQVQLKISQSLPFYEPAR